MLIDFPLHVHVESRLDLLEAWVEIYKRQKMKMLSMSTTADGQLHQPSDRKGIFGTDGWTDKLMNKWTENGKK